MTHPESNSDGEGGLTEGGSGDGGTLGTNTHDTVEDAAGGTQTGMVVSGGGVADPSEDEATATGDRGLG
jgi:hypothetical protein